MSIEADLKNSAAQHGISLTDEQLARLARGESVDLKPESTIRSAQFAADAGGCDCPDGYISFGHKPKWCLKLWPPALTVLPNC